MDFIRAMHEFYVDAACWLFVVVTTMASMILFEMEKGRQFVPPLLLLDVGCVIFLGFLTASKSDETTEVHYTLLPTEDKSEQKIPSPRLTVDIPVDDSVKQITTVPFDETDDFVTDAVLV